MKCAKQPCDRGLLWNRHRCFVTAFFLGYHGDLPVQSFSDQAQSGRPTHFLRGPTLSPPLTVSSGEFSDGTATRVGESGRDVVFRQDMFNVGIELVVNVGYVESECCWSVRFRRVVCGDWSSLVGGCCALVLFVWPEWLQLCVPLMRRAEHA